MAVTLLTEANFQTFVLSSELPVLIDLYADWCGPCKVIAPILEQLSVTYGDRMKFGKVDVEKSPEIAQMFQVQSIPTLAIVQAGRVVDMMVGAQDRATLEQRIQRIIGGAPTPAAAKGPEPWDAKRLKLGLDAGMVIPVDVRAAVDYNRVRIPTAVHAPADTIADEVEALRAHGKRLVFYARTTDAGRDAAQAMAKAGLSTAWLEGGLLAWEGELLPVEKP